MAKSGINEAISHNGGSIIKSLPFGILIIAFLTLKVLFALLYPANNSLRASDLTDANILQAINQQRTLRNLSPLNTNSLLTQAAQYKTDDMQARHYFAHIDPDGHYIWDKIVVLGYTPYAQLGENLAIEFYDTDSLVSAWMNSPEHRSNILNAGFLDQGMGVTLGNVQQGQYYSAIGNTFGTLAPLPKAKAAPAPKAPAAVVTKPAPKPSPTPEVKATPTLVPTILPTEAPELPTPTVAIAPIEPRQSSSALGASSQNNFALPTQVPSTSTQASPAQAGVTIAATNALQNNTLSIPGNSNTNRYLILAAGVLLLFLVILDIQKAVEKKLTHLDKKFNNFILLLISLVVIAFMYWL